MHYDAIVIGGNMRGLVTASLLSRLGYSGLLLETAPRLGGADASFPVGGDGFEFGMHVLDFERSAMATRLLTDAVDGAVHKHLLQRGMVLRGHLVPYAPLPEELPAPLRALLRDGPIVDDLGAELPTRARIATIYGDGWADLIFDEVLPSYPTEARHAAFGVPEGALLGNIYPWFFPRVPRAGRPDDLSRSFHDRLRAGIPQHILFPREGGFGGFVEGLRRKLSPRIEVRTGVADLRVELQPGSHTVAAVHAGGQTHTARHVFWCAPWTRLADLLGLPCQDPATDRVMIGSFRFEGPLRCPYDEVLIGDPRFAISRMYFPARFRGTDDPLVQVEFAFPEADPRPRDPETWRDRWVDDLRRLGVTDSPVVRFDLKSVKMHFNAYGMEGERLVDADPSLIRPDSNLVAVAPSMANLNLNAHLPLAVAEVIGALAGPGDRG